MWNSATRRRGQTAIEVLFIMGIILTGIVIMVPTYMKEDTPVTLVTYVKNSASNACAYLNSGVTVNKDPYRILNEIITASNYTGKSFRVISISSRDLESKIIITVTVGYSGKIDLDDSTIASRIKRFIIKDILANTNASLDGSSLYYRDKEVVIRIRVVRG